MLFAGEGLIVFSAWLFCIHALERRLSPMVMTAQPDWRTLDDEALLDWRISDLRLRMGGLVATCVAQLYKELKEKNLLLLPPCHIGDEWFCPEGCAAIFIPFYLFDDRLRRLELKQILEVEGGTREECMKLLRHEAGHAYSYAYRLQRKKKWQQHFGLASQEYPETYRPRRYSKSYVIHLDDWYAQMHPDEDWAETFAVWLAPGGDWRKQYGGWPALRKLEYVDELMCALAGREPMGLVPYRASLESSLRIKLKTYYRRKQKAYAESFTDLFDVDLQQLFPKSASRNGCITAEKFLRQKRRNIVGVVCKWTREPKYRVNEILGDLIERSKELGLAADAADSELPSHLISYITSLVMNHRFTGRYKHTR